MHEQNMDQVHAHVRYQNVTDLQATEYHTKSTDVYNTELQVRSN